MVNYTTGIFIYNNCTSQGVWLKNWLEKPDCPKNTVGDVWQPVLMDMVLKHGAWNELSHANNSESFRQNLSKHMK
jgi:hypothetical protein